MEQLKIAIIYVMRMVMTIYCLFPVKRGRYFFCSYDGRSVSCNPMYFNRYLIESEEAGEYIWAVEDAKHVYVPEDLRDKIKLVSTKSLKYFYYGYTSQYIIFNMGLYRGSFFRKRKGQFFVNTWHGGGAYKKVSGQTNISKKEQFVERLCGRQIDYFLSSSRRFSEVMSESECVPIERFLEVGMPRNDILFDRSRQDITDKVYRMFGVDRSTKIALYAPTYRGNTSSAQAVMELDGQSVKKALEKRFGGKWVIFVRSHYFTHVDCMDGMIDVSAYNDMQELLYSAAVLITDYSSSIWDFSLMEKPGFLLTTDLKEYQSERNFYTPIDKWQYPYAETNERLCELISAYDEGKAKQRIEQHHKLLGRCENGQASKKLYDALHR